MRIGIDARFFGSGHTGLGRYAEELVTHLARHDTGHEFVLIVRPEATGLAAAFGNVIEVCYADVAPYSLREQIGLTRALGRAGVDLMHFTHFNHPISYRGRFVLSIADLILLHYPGRGRGARLRVPPMRLVLKAGARRSSAIITVSDHQKQLIVEELGTPEDKVFVTHEAVNPWFRPPAHEVVSNLRRRLGVDGSPMLLYVGQWREHRNVPRLIEAFSIVRKQLDAKLVLVGARDRAFAEIQDAIARHGVEDALKAVGFVADEELPAYYGTADAFVFPSLVEGFGLPPLEAMACGAPVAASNASPMPEVLGDAPAYFDPYDAADMASTILRLLEDREHRALHRQRGFARAAAFSWDRTARATLEIYESVLGI